MAHVTNVLVLVLLQLCPVQATLAIAEDRCDDMRRELVRNKEQIVEYADALNKSSSKNDYDFMGVLNSKMGQLINRSQELEKELADCPQRKAPIGSQGMAGIKSDEEVIAEKNCSELKKMLVPLIRKINGLKRREKSLLSGLNPEEKSELKQAETEMRIVKENLEKKCTGPDPTSTLPRRLRR